MRTLIAALVLPLAALAGGCTFNRPPTISVVEARVADASDEAVVVEFTLATENENPEPLPLKRIDYALAIDGKTVFSGSRSPEATIRRESKQTIRIPAAFRLEPSLRGGTRAYTITGSLTYLEPGKFAEILFDAEVSQPSTNFSGSGSIDLSAK